MPINSRTLTFKAGGKDFQCYLAEPPSGGGPGILLLHAWWGLKPFFKQVCDRLAENGFIALAPDLRDGRVAQTVEEAQQMMEKSDTRQVTAVVTVAMNYLLHYPSRMGRKIGIIGYSMGAAWALDMAAEDPQEVAATVMYYGTGDASYEKLKSKVLGHFSDVDEWEPYEQVKGLEQKMRAAGVDVEFHTYPGVAHWFVEEDRPEYDAAAAKLAWRRTLEFLKTGLGLSSSSR
ncbi:MAG TPA: dienelactone hydrolase family protein [Anaerolineae bacterium]